MWVPSVSVWCEDGGKGGGTGGKTATDSSVCPSHCLSPWWCTRMPIGCLLFRCDTITPVDTTPGTPTHPTQPMGIFSQAVALAESLQEQHEEKAPEWTNPPSEKLTFPSSSSALRSNDRCSWTTVEPCRGGVGGGRGRGGQGKETRGRQNKIHLIHVL